MDLSITMLSAAILIAASSNNVAKAIYAIAFGGKSSRRPALVLVVLALLGFAAAAVYILRVPPDRLSDVLITEQLHRRVPHNADYKREKLAIQELAQQMVDHPEGLMPGLVRLAIEACDAQSAGISLYEPDPPGPGIFRWWSEFPAMQRRVRSEIPMKLLS